MELLLAHPAHAQLDCRTCQAWELEANLQVKRRGDPKAPVRRRGAPPCRSCPKIPPGVEPRPANAPRLDGTFWRIVLAYLEVKAGAPMPDDAVFRRHCALIRLAEDRHQRGQQGRVADLLQIGVKASP